MKKVKSKSRVFLGSSLVGLEVESTDRSIYIGVVPKPDSPSFPEGAESLQIILHKCEREHVYPEVITARYRNSKTGKDVPVLVIVSLPGDIVKTKQILQAAQSCLKYCLEKADPSKDRPIFLFNLLPLT